MVACTPTVKHPGRTTGEGLTLTDVNVMKGWAVDAATNMSRIITNDLENKVSIFVIVAE